jgi:hypothetical protein
MDVLEASQYVDDSRVRLVALARWGKIALFRLMTPKLIGDGVAFEAINPIAVLEDDDYTALWSDTRLDSWQTLNPDIATRWDDSYWSIDTNNRLFIGLQKDTNYPHQASMGGLGYQIEAGGTRPIAVIQFDVAFVNIPANWVWQVLSANRGFGGIAFLTGVTSPGTSTRSYCLSLGTPLDAALFEVFNSTGATQLYIGETGAAYTKMTNVRVATSVANLVNTTVTSGAIAIGAAAPTVGSIANLYVGQRVVINSGAADSESVVVTAVGTTTFSAVFTKAHLAGATVRAIVVYDQEIVSSVLSQVTTLNPSSGLKSSAALIRSSGRDLFNKAWSAASPISVINELATPADYAQGVTEDGYLYYWPKGTNAREWSVRAADIELSRPVESTRNSIRVVYDDAAGMSQVTASSIDAASVAANGITRRRTLSAQTTSATEAALIRDTTLADQKKRTTQSSITFRTLYDRAGVEYPPGMIREGDTITITNLPAILSTFSLRTFTVADVAEDLVTGRVSVTPEEPLPRLDVLFARLAL